LVNIVSRREEGRVGRLKVTLLWREGRMAELDQMPRTLTTSSRVMKCSRRETWHPS
jgi:hypothetical protein